MFENLLKHKWVRQLSLKLNIEADYKPFCINYMSLKEQGRIGEVR